MPVKRLCKLKDIRKYTNNIITPYAARQLYLKGLIPGVRLNGQNSPILIDLDGLEKWLDEQSQSNIKQAESISSFGVLRKIQ